MSHLLLLALVACGGGNTETAKPADEVASTTEAPPPAEAKGPASDVPAAYKSLFQPLAKAEVPPADQPKIELGRMLYYETRLSKGKDISCNSCHKLDAFGVDGTPTSTGFRGQKGGRNAPTVFHAFGHVAQFWDGRAKDVEEQALGPILNPIEMALPDAATAVKAVEGIPGYQAAFAAAFPGEASPITFENIGKAIGAFERYLVTPAPFDAWLAGDGAALTPEQRHGLDVFVQTGCTSCHSGPYVGGAAFMKLGLVEPYPTKDLGRYEVTKNEADKYVFKVPSLRNVTKTGPWFHDGSVTTLEDAVTKMGKHQLGKALEPADVSAIVAFLGALEGQVDAAYVAAPQLPPDGPPSKH